MRIGSRGSRLALAQAQLAVDALAATGVAAAIVAISTRGDRISQRRPRAGWATTDGQFTRELEEAVLRGTVDVAVHSYKDLPTAGTAGLVVGAVLQRADARDCFLTADGSSLEEVVFGAHVGTSSPRRAAQLAAARPDLLAVPIRGNVETRLRRLKTGEYDALVLAAAGLDRLGIPVPDEARLPFELVLPAPAQGALAIQAREGDTSVLATLNSLDHAPTRIAVEAERALLRRIGGGCLAPLGAFGESALGRLRLRAAYEDRWGELHQVDVSGPEAEPEVVVAEAADRITAAAALSTTA
jgi:hydroxymethylbilane synthase